MLTIDFHTHNFPAKLAPRAIEVMYSKLVACGQGALKPFGDGTLDTQLKDMDRARIDLSVACPIATAPEHFEPILKRADKIRSSAEGAAAAERIVQLVSVHPKDPDFAARLKKVAAEGFRGIKLHPNYQGIRLDDPDLVPFFAAARDEGLFVMSHCGWDPGYVNTHLIAGPDEIAALLTAVPGLVFVAAHLGGEYDAAPRATDKLLDFPNLYIDTAVMYNRMDAEEPRRIIREWPAERILFGTDYFWADQSRYLDWVRECRKNDSDLEKILHLNAEKLLF